MRTRSSIPIIFIWLSPNLWSPISEKLSWNIFKLSTAKSTGCSLLTNRVLRETAPFKLALWFASTISHFDHLFFQKIGNRRLLLWAERLTPNPWNYRLGSLLPAVGKILDNVLCKVLSSYQLKYRLLSHHQLGFLPGSSATHQLVYIIDKRINDLKVAKCLQLPSRTFKRL